MYDRLEAAGCVVRFDETIRPTMFHAATISQPELEALRSIKQIIRMGRVTALEVDKIILDEGVLETTLTLCMSIARQACRAPCRR